MNTNTNTNTQLASPGEAPAIPANTGLSIFDEGSFDSLYRIAEAMAQSSLVPKTLTEDKDGPYPLEKVAANCFLVVEQAQRWGLSPFACLGCASVVHGRLMWEGKLVSAVIEAKLGVRLSYAYSGKGDARSVVVSGTLPDESEPRTVEGTVGNWKTTGAGSPWGSSANHDRQLAYRGAREWARRHAPAVLLGVYTDDEAAEIPMRDVTPRVTARQEPVDVFSGQKKSDGCAADQAKKPGRKTEGDAPSAEAEPIQSQPSPEPQETQSTDVPPATKGEGSPSGETFALEAPPATKAWIEGYKSKEGVSKGKPWKLHVVSLIVDGESIEANTFSDTLGSVAEFNVDRPALVDLEETPKGWKLVNLQVVSTEEEGDIV